MYMLVTPGSARVKNTAFVRDLTLITSSSTLSVVCYVHVVPEKCIFM